MPFPPAPAPDVIRVVSYNIRKCRGLDNRRDPHRVARVLAGFTPDIVALQEADRRLGARPAALPRDVIREEAGLIAAPVARTQVSLGWHGNALLLAHGWQMIDLDHLPLPGLEPRGALIVDLDSPKGPLRVIATHLGLRRRDRQRQLTLIMARLASKAKRPSLVVGDMNEWSPRQGFAPLDPYFTLHNPGRSFPARYPVAALDRVATGPGVQISEMGVTRTGAAGRASDHLPVWADIELWPTG